MQGAVLRVLAALRRLHERVVPWLEVPRDRLPFWAFGLVLLLIVVIGAILRTRLLLDGLRPEDLWLGQPLLTSADGFYFASGVGNVLTDDWGTTAGVARLDIHGLVGIGALLGKLGFAREAVFTWLPVVIGPLIALPLAFIGRAYERSVVGLGSALIAVVAPTYLARTAIAYFDTDMFAVTVPLVVSLFLVRLFRAAPGSDLDPEGTLATARRDGFLAALTLSAYVWLYDQGLPLTQMLSGLAALGLLCAWLFARAAPTAYRSCGAPEAARHALLIAIATAPVYWAIRAGATVLAQLGLKRLRIRPKSLAILAILATLAAFATSPAMRHLFNKFATYTSAVTPIETFPGEETTVRRDPTAELQDPTWKWHDTTGIVAEARVLPFERMTAKVAGSALLAIAGMLGFVLFLAWRPSLVPLVPIAAIGCFAFLGGHRFLIYLGPIIALGVAYLAARLTRALPQRLHLVASGLLAIAATAPALAETKPGDVKLSIDRDEAEALTALDALSSPTDTTISWWDFGYAIKYFAKTRVITDGARRGDDASLAAEILLTPSPARAAQLARLAADANAMSAGGAAQVLIDQAKARQLGPVAFLAEVEAGRWPPLQRSGEVYLFLTKRLLPILPVLEAFRPTPGGFDREAAYLHLYEGVRSEGPILYLAGGITVDADRVIMRRPGADGRGGFEERRLRAVHVIGGTGATLHKGVRNGDPTAPTGGILLRDLRVFIEFDARLLDSQWAQLYLFENADPRYYEPVHITPTTKIYRFK